MMNCYVQISNKDYLLQHSSFIGHTTKVIMGLRVKVIYYENREVTHIIKNKENKLNWSWKRNWFAVSWEQLMSILKNQQCIMKTLC